VKDKGERGGGAWGWRKGSHVVCAVICRHRTTKPSWIMDTCNKSFSCTLSLRCVQLTVTRQKILPVKHYCFQAKRNVVSGFQSQSWLLKIEQFVVLFVLLCYKYSVLVKVYLIFPAEDARKNAFHPHFPCEVAKKCHLLVLGNPGVMWRWKLFSGFRILGDRTIREKTVVFSVNNVSCR
jgi:hypothetical protein